MKVIVLAGGYDQIALIQELKKRNCYVILIDYLEEPVAKPFADVHYRASTLDEVAVRQIAISEGIDIITTACTDQALLTVAKVSEQLSLPCYITYEQAVNVTNKEYMKKIMRLNRIPTALHTTISCIEEIHKSNIVFPMVVKPVDCNSSKGVTKVTRMDEMAVAVHEAFKLSRSQRVIVEEYIEGREISIDVYVAHGKACVLSISESDKVPNESTFTIISSRYPVSISRIAIKNIQSIAQKIADSFHIDNSPILIQTIVNGDSVYVIEFSARMGGGTKYRLIERISGINIMSLYVDRVLGNLPKVEKIASSKLYLAIHYCYCLPGTFDHLDQFESSVCSGLIDEYYQYKSKGTVIVQHSTSSDRIAGYMLSARSMVELLKKESTAKESLRVISSHNIDMLIHDML